MVAFNSEQIAKKSTITNPGTKLDPTEQGGRQRVVRFSFTGDVAQNDTVNLAEIPQGARIKEGEIAFSAFGAGVTLDIGDATDDDKFLVAEDVAAAGQVRFAHTPALDGMLSERTTGLLTVIALFEAADPASGTIQGWISYVVD